MGLATLAVTGVSRVTDQADAGGLAQRPAPGGSNADGPAADGPAAAEARARNGTDDARGSDAAEIAERVEGAEKLEGAGKLEGDDELDALFDLGDEIATLAAHLHAATYRLLTLIAEFDRLQGWEPEGHRSCAHWLAFRTGIDLGAAREKVRAARALTELPEISASMALGELSFAKVRALTRVATPQSERDLLELARCSTAAQLESTVRAWRRMCRFDENELERIRHRSRCFSVFPDEEGMYLVRGRLDPEVGAMLMRAIDAASDALFRAGTSGAGTSEEIEPKQRRADAVGLLAERALAAGSGRTERSGAAAEGERTNDVTGEGAADHTANATNEGTADATSEGTAAATSKGTAEPAAGADIVPLSGTRAERYQVMLYVDAATLEHEGEPERSELEDGTRVSAETSRRLSCDASVVRITKAPSCEVQNGKGPDDSMGDGKAPDDSMGDVGRRTRTIPPAIRRALEARDRGCRFPGCGLRFTDAHHVTHWADGGETKLENLVLLCRFHHRLVHEEGYTVNFPRGKRLYFLDPSMRLLPDQPPPPPRLPPEPVEALVGQNRFRTVEPGPFTSAARYKREDDIPTPVIIRALRALDEPALKQSALKQPAWKQSALEQPAPEKPAPDEESPPVS